MEAYIQILQRLRIDCRLFDDGRGFNRSVEQEGEG